MLTMRAGKTLKLNNLFSLKRALKVHEKALIIP